MHVRYRDYHKVDDEWVRVFEDGYFRLSSITTGRRVVSTVTRLMVRPSSSP